MEFVTFITDENVVKFFLLFARFSGIFAFFPIYGDNAIPFSLKAALIFYFTVLFFPLAPAIGLTHIDPTSIMLGVFSEIMLGFIASIFVNLSLAVVNFLGENSAFYMSFTISTMFDPSTGGQVSVITKFLSLIALLIILAVDGHHLIIIFVDESLHAIKLGGVFFDDAIALEMIKAVSHFYLIGFAITFPLIAVSLMVDLVFGMIMKSMPMFNPLSVGFQVKIGVYFVLFIVMLGAFFVVFKSEFFKSFAHLTMFF
jgi:flagellar biosynthesis protein FliR